MKGRLKVSMTLERMVLYMFDPEVLLIICWIIYKIVHYQSLLRDNEWPIDVRPWASSSQLASRRDLPRRPPPHREWSRRVRCGGTARLFSQLGRVVGNLDGLTFSISLPIPDTVMPRPPNINDASSAISRPHLVMYSLSRAI